MASLKNKVSIAIGLVIAVDSAYAVPRDSREDGDRVPAAITMPPGRLSQKATPKDTTTNSGGGDLQGLKSNPPAEIKKKCKKGAGIAPPSFWIIGQGKEKKSVIDMASTNSLEVVANEAITLDELKKQQEECEE